MDFVQQFITLPMAILMLAIYVLVEFQRRCLEYKWPKIKETNAWRRLFLPLGPPGTGIIFSGFVGYFTSYPFPEMLGDSLTAKMLCGLVCGLGSGHVYRIFKAGLKMIKDKLTGKKSDEAPPSSEEPTIQ